MNKSIKHIISKKQKTTIHVYYTSSSRGCILSGVHHFPCEMSDDSCECTTILVLVCDENLIPTSKLLPRSNQFDGVGSMHALPVLKD